MSICPVCKGKSYLIWRERKYRVYRCRHCSLCFLHPLPENPSTIYNEEYFKRWYIRYYNERRTYITKLFSIFEKYIPPKGKLLDVGCGIGILLDVAKEQGYDVYGQDVSPFAVNYCREKGYKVFDKPLTQLNLPEASFDIITILDVIAHLKDPVSYIEDCRKLLKPGGYLIIKTPYHPLYLFLFANLLSFTGKSRVIIHIPAQLFHFTSEAFKKILPEDIFEYKKNICIDDFHFLFQENFFLFLKTKISEKSGLFIFKKKNG